jgi:predicted MPP superfamily phosphohydrolase
MRYLRYCIERINHLDADIVILTGDYVTHDIYGGFRKKMIKLISNIQSQLGVYACLGNHDYGIGGVFGSLREHQMHRIIRDMTNCGVKVLRNGSSVLEIDGESLWFVGLGDLWANDLEPHKAFAKVGTDGPVIALAHNPDSVKHLEEFDFDAVMCGHTHGIPVQLVTSFGWPLFNRHDYYAGLYSLGNKKLYVNRGLGRFGRTLFNTRPEITIFTLH